MSWPYPGDSPVARARRVTHAYRAALAAADPAACAELDARMTDWGQGWVAPRVELHDLDDWIDPATAADLAYVAPAQLRVWRHRGRLTGRQRNGRWEYRVRDVLALASTTRHRTRGATPVKLNRTNRPPLRLRSVQTASLCPHPPQAADGTDTDTAPRTPCRSTDTPRVARACSTSTCTDDRPRPPTLGQAWGCSSEPTTGADREDNHEEPARADAPASPVHNPRLLQHHPRRRPLRRVPHP